MREALIALEVEGYVDVRPGSGIMVTTPKSEAPDCSGDEGPLEILRVRSLIEGAVAAEVARDFEPKDIAALEEILRAMEAETRASARLSADRQFHLYITAKLENKVLLPILGDQYGRVLERGELKVQFDGGAFSLTYYEHQIRQKVKEIEAKLSKPDQTNTSPAKEQT